MSDSTRLTDAVKELREFAKIGLRDDSTWRRIRLLERVPILCNLPAVRAAGQDSTAQFEYLVQAIVDVIDGIDRQAGLAASLSGLEIVTTSRQLEAGALRTLFGLTEYSRRAIWQKRQEDAARVLGISWEYFRKKKQDTLLHAIVEQLLVTTKADGHVHQSFLHGGLTAFATQADIEEDVVAYIRESGPRRALLLELSTATIGPILLALRDADAHIRLLVSNPYKATATWHQERILLTLTDRLQRDFSGCDGLDMRIYDVPPRLRGRLIGDLIALGWYTARDNKRVDPDPTNFAATEVWGHDNALVAGNVHEPNGQILASWFKREFDRLWHHRLTVGGSEMMRLLRLDL